MKQIRAESLMKTYGGRKVVDGVSVYVRQGEVVGLLGPNGAGKTTSFYMITGMIRSDSGRIFIDEQEVSSLPMYKRARLGVGYLPQETSVFRKLTVEENLLAVLEARGGLGRRERREEADRLMEEFKIARLRKSRAYTLSGGERRRLEIARALTTKPDFLLLDEPFAGIDPIAVEDIQSVIFSLRDRGMGILITDHSVRETLATTNRAYIMFEGKVLIEGSAEHLAQDEEARRIYLGKSFSLN
ncbi:MAG: transporter ATP-binding protein [Fibrobacteria bacterium]|jgi:lipopolysaccharide export system ATP-binding protein|nr:transporter ATP-binding protein [Fibrobacteria bacterium]